MRSLDHNGVFDAWRSLKGGRRLCLLTAYDDPSARLLDACGLDAILVGDSVATVVYGDESTRAADIPMMIRHGRAVVRAVEHTPVIVDAPYRGVQTVTVRRAVDNLIRLVDTTGCHALKVEWFDSALSIIGRLVNKSIPVMGHVGLTPQTADRLGGYKVQGRDERQALAILEQASRLQEAGCFAVVIECVPAPVARIITASLNIPTIGIGAGPDCDGQILVLHDCVGLQDRIRPRFIKRFCDAAAVIREAAGRYIEEVRAGVFPDATTSYGMDAQHLERLLQAAGKRRSTGRRIIRKASGNECSKDKQKGGLR